MGGLTNPIRRYCSYKLGPATPGLSRSCWPWHVQKGEVNGGGGSDSIRRRHVQKGEVREGRVRQHKAQARAKGRGQREAGQTA